MFDHGNGIHNSKGLPTASYHKEEDSVGHNYVVEQLAETIKQKMLDSNVEESHLVLLTRTKDGEIDVLNVRDCDKVMITSKAHVPLATQVSARDIYNRLSSQLYISSDYIGPSDDVHFDMTIGDQDMRNTAIIKVNE